MVRKIVITGPESTGKSTLARRLAAHYKTVWVPEYAREYIDHLDRPYGKNDLIEIARGQLEREDLLTTQANGLLFIDTDLTVLEIWYRHRFGKIPPYIETNIAKRKYDLYLLPDIDLPWKDDPQREHPHLRKYFMKQYEETLKTRGIRYHIIRGGSSQRLANAIEAVESAKKKW